MYQQMTLESNRTIRQNKTVEVDIVPSRLDVNI